MIELSIQGTPELIEEAIQAANEALDAEERQKEQFHSALAAHIIRIFQINKNARQQSGIEEEIFESLRAFNGEYGGNELSAIRSEGGSEIYMNLTATKCRAACSWIKDILMSPNNPPFLVEPSPIPELPEETSAIIEESIRNQYAHLLSDDARSAQKTIKELNQLRRDIKDAVMAEIDKEAKYAMKLHERKITDQLVEGDWDNAFSDFIEDFTVFPVAIMKGPIINLKNKPTWVGGRMEVVKDYVFLNKRVSPLDIYPSPGATKINEGDLIEHIRLSPKELSSLRGVEGYDDLAIDLLLESNRDHQATWIDTGIEQEKADLELKTVEDQGLIDGLHYFGSAPVSTLENWGLCPEGMMDGEVEIEAILVGNEVIKCLVNDDPLCRRPYYKASWQNRPGSWWGRSLPSLMRDIQRICNATARALMNNMGLASGPQIGVTIDRLADRGPIEGMRPLKVWQLLSDPTGAGGKAIDFFTIPSNASELLAVYEKFEAKADDATGIPRYAYGNEKSGGAAATASGLSMLLESASKSIKDAVRHIDDGLIVPRISYQFYWNMLNQPDDSVNGDVVVIARGSSALTVKGAEQLRRNEFLQITANPFDQQIMGMEGRASILREVSKGLGMDIDVIPTRLDLIDKEEEMRAQADQQRQAEEEKLMKSLAATKMQIDGQMAMAQGAQQLKAHELALKQERQDAEVVLKSQELAQRREEAVTNVTAKLQGKQMEVAQKDLTERRRMAVSK
jgi:hypothetical protein